MKADPLLIHSHTETACMDEPGAAALARSHALSINKGGELGLAGVLPRHRHWENWGGCGEGRIKEMREHTLSRRATSRRPGN